MIRDRRERMFRSGPVVRMGSIVGRDRASEVAVVIVAVKVKVLPLYKDIEQIISRQPRKK
jgi:hypothetical protein